MAKIYWSVDQSTVGHPIYWLDEMGREHHEDSSKSGATFEQEHPGAQWLKWSEFSKRAERAAIERTKLAAWKEWAV